MVKHCGHVCLESLHEQEVGGDEEVGGVILGDLDVAVVHEVHEAAEAAAAHPAHVNLVRPSILGRSSINNVTLLTICGKRAMVQVM